MKNQMYDEVISVEQMIDETIEISKKESWLYADLISKTVNISGIAFRWLGDYTDGTIQLEEVDHLHFPIELKFNKNDIKKVTKNTPTHSYFLDFPEFGIGINHDEPLEN